MIGRFRSPGRISGIAAVCAVLCAGLYATSAKAARAGTQAAPVSPCAQATTLRLLGRVAAAETAYEKTLESKPGAACAKQGLEAIDRGEVCAAGRALQDSGEASEAQKAYLDVLRAVPASQCAAEGVEEASDPALWEDLETVSSDALTALGVAALAFGALVAIALVLVNLLARLPWFKSHWPAARIRRPTVSVEALDDSGLKDQKLGAGVAALLRERIEPGSVGGAVKVVSGADATEETWIERISEVGEQGKIAAALIGLLASLLPRQHVKVTGELHPAAEPTGAGVSLELYRKLESKGSTTFWAASLLLPTDEDLGTIRKLAVPAAAWVSHEVTTQTEGEPVGSTDATSWAFFKAGVARQEEGQSDSALRLYLEALAHDPWNYGALRNLAGLEAASGMYVSAIARLMKALASLEAK